MRVRDLYIESCDWDVRVYIASTCYYIDEICKSLYDIDCPSHVIFMARNSMENCRLNTGLTYSNPAIRKSIIVVAIASSPMQFLNSITHEVRHLTDHILKEVGYKVGGEPVAYLSGDIIGELWKDVHDFICPNCYSHERRC